MSGVSVQHKSLPVSQLHLRQQQSALSNQLCTFEARKCFRACVDGERFCLRHVRELHRESRYRRCNYSSARTARRCANVLRRHDGRSANQGFCMDHLRVVTAVRRQAAHRNRPRQSATSLAHTIAQHSPAHKEHMSSILSPNTLKNTLDQYSESSDEEEDVNKPVKNMVFGTEAHEFHNDFDKDPLRNASVYTNEEVAMLTRERLIRLQATYTEFTAVLAHKYRMRRAKYLTAFRHAQLQEKAVVSSTSTTSATPTTCIPSATKQSSRTLRAFGRYRRRTKVPSLLYEQAKLKRKMAANIDVSKDMQPAGEQCSYGHINLDSTTANNDQSISTATTQCSNRAVTATKYCTQHLCEDKHQLLFGECSVCGRAVALSLHTNTTCWLDNTELLCAPAPTITTCDPDPVNQVQQAQHDQLTPSLPPFNIELAVSCQVQLATLAHCHTAPSKQDDLQQPIMHMDQALSVIGDTSIHANEDMDTDMQLQNDGDNGVLKESPTHQEDAADKQSQSCTNTGNDQTTHPHADNQVQQPSALLHEHQH